MDRFKVNGNAFVIHSLMSHSSLMVILWTEGPFQSNAFLHCLGSNFFTQNTSSCPEVRSVIWGLCYSLIKLMCTFWCMLHVCRWCWFLWEYDSLLCCVVHVTCSPQRAYSAYFSLIISLYVDLHLVLRLRMSGAIPLLPLYALMACMGTALLPPPPPPPNVWWYLVSMCIFLCKYNPVIGSPTVWEIFFIRKCANFVIGGRSDLTFNCIVNLYYYWPLQYCTSLLLTKVLFVDKICLFF